MWAAIVRFEIRYQLRQPLFHLVTAFLCILLFVAGMGEGAGGATGRLHLNAPPVILESLVKALPLVLFLVGGLVASAVVRDFDRGTSELFFTKPVSRFDYLAGRFAGAMAVCALACALGTTALAAGSLVPGLDPGRVGPFRLAPYAFGVGVLVLPTVLALGAVSCAVAIWTRSSLATFAGLVVAFALGAIGGGLSSRGGSAWLGQLLDPLGVAALADALRYWTVEELNAATPGIGGMLLWNRVLWLGLGAGAIVLAMRAFDPARIPTRRKLLREEVRDVASPAATMPRRPPAPARTSGARSLLAQFAGQVRRETAAVLGSWPFLALLPFGLFVLLQAAGSAATLFGMPVQARTSLMLGALQGGYSIVLLLVVVLYSGQAVWRERALGLEEIIDSMPMPSGAYLGAKLCALLLVIAAWLAVGVLVLIGFQLLQGDVPIEPALHARGAALSAFYPALMAVLACFLHTVAGSRLVGYGLVLLFVLGWDLLEELGFEHHLYRYASLPPTPHSDISGYGPFLLPFGWYSLYWASVAIVLVGASVLLWPRGTDGGWRARWRAARARFHGGARTLVIAGALGSAVTGAWIFYNTNVVNAYVPTTVAAGRSADYERLYSRYRGATLPRIEAVRTGVDIFPDARRVDVRGAYRVRNRSGAPVRDIHLSFPEGVRVHRIDLPGRLVLEDIALGYRIYRLAAPLASGEAAEIGFDLSMGASGFVNHGTPTKVVGNGTYFTKRDLLPVVGYDPHRELVDPDARRRQGLVPLRPMAEADDPSARGDTPRASDADRIEFEATVSTVPDQIAVTSGDLQREWTAGGRRYFHYRSGEAITHHFGYASARYEVLRDTWDGVAIEIYHHPGHGANVRRMAQTAKRALAYNSAAFGPYPHRYLRIVEVPGYERDATAFPGLVAYTESLGFHARFRGGEAIDYPAYVVAHEVAHQWWGQQLVGANVQGVGALHESLAQYSALMVMEQLYGREGLRRVLDREFDWYLRGRAGGQGVEPPLVRVEREDYVYYHKGALAMHALRDAVGEARLNRTLARYLASSAGHGPPYPTMGALVQAFRSEFPDEVGPLVHDLFESTTTHDVRLTGATSRRLDDGHFRIRVELHLSKRRAGAGAGQEVPVDDWIDIAVFDGRDGAGPFVVARRHVRGAQVAFEIDVDRAPRRVALDPYNKLIDRDRADNVVALGTTGGSTGDDVLRDRALPR